MNNIKQHNRVPAPLQTVFLASNRGLDVCTPPPGNIAARVFKSILQHTRPNIRKQQSITLPNDHVKDLSTDVEAEAQQIECHHVLSIQAEGSETSPVGNICFQASKTEYMYQKTLNIEREEISVASTATLEEPMRASKRKIHPQIYLDEMLSGKGYNTNRYYVHESGYRNTTTDTQRISYNKYIVDLVKARDTDQLRLLFATGLSTNPANVHGEGLLNMVCRLGYADVLKVMIDSGCDVQVSDDYGRTPLHDACWACEPAFDVVEQLLSIDARMLYMMDIRGSLPLSYVPEKDYTKWIQFLTSKAELWPSIDDEKIEGPPPLTLQKPHNRPVKESSISISVLMLRMLASGRMSPQEVTALIEYSEGEDESGLADFDCDSFERHFIRCLSSEGYTYDSSCSSSSDEYSESSITSCDFDDVSAFDVKASQQSYVNTHHLEAILLQGNSNLGGGKDQIAKMPVRRCSIFTDYSKQKSPGPLIYNHATKTRQSPMLCKRNSCMSEAYKIEPNTNHTCHLQQRLLFNSSLERSTADTASDSSSGLYFLGMQEAIESEKMNYCIPESDDGLLFGSC